MTNQSVSAAGYDARLEERGGAAAAVDAVPPRVGQRATENTRVGERANDKSVGERATETPRVGIRDQLEEVGREIRQRERFYPELIAKGRLNANTAERKLSQLRAAHATLSTIAAHADGLRVLIGVLQRVAKYGSSEDSCAAAGSTKAISSAPEERAPVNNAEALALLHNADVAAVIDHPAVAAVLATFPDAVIETIKPLEPRA